MRGTPVWPVLGIVALVATLAGYLLGTGTGENPVEPPLPTARPIHDLVLADVDGKPQALDQWRGRILVVNYWATWCPPCRDEMPGFSRLQEQYRAKMVQFVGISIDDPDKIVEFQKEVQVAYPLLIADLQTMQSSAGYGNRAQALPFTAIFDGQGRLAATRLGRWDEADLSRMLDKLVSG